jgi:hypothetical protein
VTTTPARPPPSHPLHRPALEPAQEIIVQPGNASGEAYRHHRRRRRDGRVSGSLNLLAPPLDSPAGTANTGDRSPSRPIRRLQMAQVFA